MDNIVHVQNKDKYNIPSDAWATGDVNNNDTIAAPVPCPTNVIELGSPRNCLIFSFSQWIAAT